ncbi:hypothetical protein PCANB_001582 [Pneumocystis canis]|nr:hypothetical protein PCANB_001582 [Pneumocystis canis]
MSMDSESLILNKKQTDISLELSRIVSDIIIGLSDGLTVPFSLAAGLSSFYNTQIILTAGMAELISGAVSMGLGGYLATKSEVDHFEHMRKTQMDLLIHAPENRLQQILAQLQSYGIVNEICKPLIFNLKQNPVDFVNFIMRFDLCLQKPSLRTAWFSAITIGISYFIGGLIPLVPYFVFYDNTVMGFKVSVVIVAIVLFIFGYLKSVYLIGSIKRSIYSAFQTLFVGIIAAGSAFGIVRLLGEIESYSMTNIDGTIRDIYHKIEREKVLIQGAQAMRGQTINETVQQSLENNIREFQKNITYLEERMHELQLRKMGYFSEHKEQDDIKPPSSPSTPSKDVSFFENSETIKELFENNFKTSEESVIKTELLKPLRLKPKYTKLDLFKYYTPYTSEKIQMMLQQLEFKLTIEKQVKDGFDKLIRLYQNENDKKNKNEAESKRLESGQKIQLLKRALKRYENLHVDIDKETLEDNENTNASTMRGSLSGILKGKVYAIRDVEHISSRTFRTLETYVVIKVDKTEFSTKTSKTDRWLQESFEIEANKANEIEFTVYDKHGNSSIPIAILYIQISDINEELRQNRVKEVSEPNWVSAEKMQNSSIKISPIKDIFDTTDSQSSSLTSRKDSTIFKGNVIQEDKSIEAWFALEPAGQIHLSLNFVKDIKNQRSIDKLGLGRQGAIRQKKMIYEIYGHKFYQHQFYQIIKCAFCAEFLKNTVGFRCTDCRYTCHKKCYLKVITKCISKINPEMSSEEKLNHHIPHRFEPITNIGANWCSHCGYILPLGKRNAQKCMECNILCHTQCRHFIPDLCGMSMEVANQILNEIRITKLKQTDNFTTVDKKTQDHHEHNTETLHNLSLSINKLPSKNNKNQLKTHLSLQNLSQFLFKSSYNVDELESKTQNKQILYSSKKTTEQKTILDATDIQETRRSRLSFPMLTSFTKNAHRTSDKETMQSSVSSKIASSDLNLDFNSIPYKGTPFQCEDKSRKKENCHDFFENSNQHVTYSQEEHANMDYQINNNKYSYNYNQYSKNPHKKLEKYDFSDSSIENYKFYNNTCMNKPTPYQPSMKTRISPFNKKKVGLDDFNFLAVLGKGNFGKVMLAEAKSTKQLYAIKVLKKESIIENEEIGSTISEKRIFLTANKGRHPFLINLHSCFQTESRVYFVMEYISGGDLLLHIQREQFSQIRAQFYAAEVLLALKHFHENGIIYRDLKLDNILLCVDGHIKVTDYGLCKEDMWYGSTTSTFCGTPEFMAPEILYEQPYGRAVDWWAFGVLIYQMLLGQSPFRGEDEDEIFDAIQSDEPLYPIHMPRDSVSILQRLLIKDPGRRLGSGPTDALEVMAHPFFRNINWDDVYHKRIHPPYFPKVNAVDISNFDVEFTHEPPILTPIQSKLTPSMQEQFRVTWDIPAFHEFRFEVEFDSRVEIEIKSGTAEIFGTELAIGPIYTFSGVKLALFTWRGCVIDVKGSPSVHYLAEETPMLAYMNMHFAIENLRIDATKNDKDGPRVLLIGPSDSGKTSLVKILASYALKQKRSPLLVNLDTREDIGSIPGSVSVTSISGILDVENTFGSTLTTGPSQYPSLVTLSYYYGYDLPTQNLKFYKTLISRLGIVCASKMSEMKEVKHSGCIIDTSGTVDQSKGYDIIHNIISDFSINIVIVLGSERLYSDMTRKYDGKNGVHVIKLQKSGGCVSREMSFIQKMQHFAVKKYFYGDFKTSLSPYSIICDFDSLIVYRVEEEIFAHSSALPIGHDVSSQKPQMIKIEEFSILQNSILAVSHANINDSTNVILESPVAGYIYVSDVDDNKKKLTILSPLPGKLPSPILIMGAFKWQDL